MSQLSRLKWFSTDSADNGTQDSSRSRQGGWSPRLHSPRIGVAVSPELSFIRLRAQAEGSDGVDSAYLRGGLEWPTTGLWLGLALPASLTNRLSLLVEGWYFVPGSSSVNMSGQSVHTADGTNLISGDLNAKTDWFSTDLRTAYEYTGGFSILAGLKYDYLQGTMTPRDDLFQWFTNVAPPGLSARIDVNLNSIFPYLGLMYRTRDGRNNIGVFAKGSPFVLQIGQDAPHTAYFAEAGLEYGIILFDNISLSCFAKYDTAHGVFVDLSDATNIFQKTPPPLGTVALYQDLTVHWSQLTLGISAALNFNLPLPF